MKKFVLMLFVSAFGLTAVNAATFLPDGFDWKSVICNIVDKAYMAKGRSAVYVPKLYKSEQYISVQSEYADYVNVGITIINQEGETVKEDVMQVAAGGENLYYVGGLESGTYELLLDFDGFTVQGLLDI